MCIKKNLVLQRCLYHLKNLKVLLLVPIVSINLLLPALAYLSYKNNGLNEICFIEITQYTMILMPLSSVWWVIFSLREYIEADGCEILFVCKDKIKLLDMFAIFVVFHVDFFIINLIFCELFKEFIFTYLSLVCVSIMMFGLTYMISFITRSTTLTLMINLLYVIASLTIKSETAFFPFYFTLGEIPINVVCVFYIPMALIGLTSCIVGLIINKRICTKN